MFWLFFFFSSRRRHTRCGRDWSSDVCSSDLQHDRRRAIARAELAHHRERLAHRLTGFERAHARSLHGGAIRHRIGERSEERRVGKCRCRWWADNATKKETIREVSAMMIDELN